MKETHLTIQIVIPTYEAAPSLLKTILSIENQSVYEDVSEIIIYLDGKKKISTLFKNKKFKKIRIIESSERKGHAYGLQKLFNTATADLVIQTNDDVILHPKAVEEIVRTFEKTRADLITTSMQPMKAKNVFQHILKEAKEIDKSMIQNMKECTFLTCNGRLLGLSKKLYSTIQIPMSLHNVDAFEYITTQENKMKHAHCQKSILFYRLPKTLYEHLKQSLKFQYSATENQFYFKSDIKKYYSIPKHVVIRAVLSRFFKNPLGVIATLGVILYSRTQNADAPTRNQKGYWITDVSTKEL